MELISLIAIFVGPLLAVAATRWLDDRNANIERKMSIFRTLMRTRRAPMSADHVGALNLIEIEFAGDREVIPAWRNLFQHLGAQHQRRPDELVLESSNAPNAYKNTKFEERLFDERQRLLAKLLHAMARKMKFRVEQLEIFEGGYLPQGWVDSELDSHKVRQFAVNLAEGRALFPVVVIDPTKTNNL